MYLSLPRRDEVTEPVAVPVRRRVARTVLLLGVVSMLTDVSTESVNAVLPNYLILVVGLSPQAFGVVNGLYNGVSAVVRVLSGWLADRTDHPKWVASLGYAVSAVSKIVLLGAHSFGAFSGVATADQLGKGIRTAPRDAMIAASSRPEDYGRAFGVHRTLDTFGAFVGPLIAFWILTVVPDGFHSVFVVAAVFAVVGLSVLLLVVPDLRPRRAGDAGRTPPPGPPVPSATPAPAPPTRPARVRLRLLAEPRFARLVIAAGLLGLLTVGETYLFLELQDRDDLALRYFPLMVVGMNLAYLGLAIPLGRLADRVGRWRVFVCGYAALVLAYLAAGGPLTGTVVTCGCLLTLGIYYAATDGVLAAMAGRLAPPGVRASAIATAQTVTAAAAFGSSLGFAELWVLIGRRDALLVVAVALVVVLPVACLLLRAADASILPAEGAA